MCAVPLFAIFCESQGCIFWSSTQEQLRKGPSNIFHIFLWSKYKGHSFAPWNFVPCLFLVCFPRLSFSMSSTQIGEEMSQNSFIKQYLEKQQELLRQRLEREAREAAELEGKPRLSLLTRSSSCLFLSLSRWACFSRQFQEYKSG